MTYFQILDWSGSSFKKARCILNFSKEEVGNFLDMSNHDVTIAEITNTNCEPKQILYRFYNDIFIKEYRPYRFASNYSIHPKNKIGSKK